MAVSDLRALLRRKGTIPAAARAVGLSSYELNEVLAGVVPTWPALRKAIAEYVGVEPAELWPEYAALDDAFFAGVERRADQGYGRRVTDPVTLRKAAAVLVEVRRALDGRDV
jgi:lambda repressor-like predicted transcriptional regulator